MTSQSISRILTKRVAVVGISLLLLLSLAVVLIDVFPTSDKESHEKPLPGVPIQDTVFAGLVSNESDPVFLPAGPILSENNSVKMTIEDSVSEPKVSKAEAEQIGIDFIHQFPYMMNVTLEPDAFWNELRDKPYYSLRYFVGEYGFYAGVHAMTGRVISISPHWSVLLQYNTSVESSILSLQEVEEKAYEFLEYNNYTLSKYVRVVGPILEEDTILKDFPSYSLNFLCAVNGCLVRGSGLSMLLSIKSGVVIDFMYVWRNVTQIPIANAVSAIQAERAANIYLNETLDVIDFNIISSSLQFYTIQSYPDVIFQLCWVVDISHELYGPLIINAIDLEVLAVYDCVIC
ncbi:MAG: hypothetical protein RTV31_14790 [Candidatus Thorarchaeota archaeon]